MISEKNSYQNTGELKLFNKNEKMLSFYMFYLSSFFLISSVIAFFCYRGS